MFEIYKDSIGEWRFRFLYPNQKSILRSSEGYKVKANAKKGLKSTLKNLAKAKQIEYHKNKAGNYYYSVKARNGNILAISHTQTEIEDLEEDINLIIKTVDFD